MNYIAHIRNKDGRQQLLRDHLLECMKIAEKLGDKLHLPHLTGLAALLHDFGKFDSKFQKYLREAVANPGSVKRGSVDHSSAGGRLLYRNLHININNNPVEKLAAEIVGNAIISHHSSQGLQDMLAPDLKSDYLQRVEEKLLDNFDNVCACFFAEVMSEEKFMKYVQQAIKELESNLVKNKETVFTYNLFFMNKFVYSCLIDADRINTMLFEEAKELVPNVNSNVLFAGYYDKLIDHLAGFNQGKIAISRIDRLRAEMSEQCDAFAQKNTGIYTLSIPTGGGKTLASLRFALKHAKDKDKERIIYIVPYTTILDQNAKTVRDILQDDVNILEHHSNVIEDENKKNDEQNSDGLNNYVTEKTVRLTKDNWESPIIFTTMVQFLEVIYGSGTRRVRRFHNLANAVIIFDEVQTVPLKCVSMFNEALNYLNDCMNSTSVLCTATQPALNAVGNKLNVAPGAEMIKNIPEVIEAFKRTKIIDKTEPDGWSVEQLTDFIKEKIDVKHSILTVLNTTSAVRKTFCLLQQEMGKKINLYHLSTMMCPAHRKVILAEIRSKLKNGERVLCISTQLIEAGVDISFECVIRSLAGCDSIAQAAGRCNRNGEKAIQEVYIIRLNSKVENLTRLREIQRGQSVTMEILNSMALDSNCFGGNLLTQEAMSVYFRKYFYDSQTTLDYYVDEIKKNLIDLMFFESPLISEYRNRYGKKSLLLLNDSFKTVSKYFHVIDSPTTSVLVPYGEEGEKLIADLNGELSSEELTVILKRAQQYSVNLYDYQKKELGVQGLIYSPNNNEYIFILLPNAYSEVFGVDSTGESEMPTMAAF